MRSFFTLALALFMSTAFSQEIYNASTVYAGTTTKYTFSYTPSTFAAGTISRSVTGGTVVSWVNTYTSTFDYSPSTAEIRWPSPGTGSVGLYYTGPNPWYPQGAPFTNYSICTYAVIIKDAPPVPNAALTFTYHCASTVVAQTNPVANEFYEWWWQTTATGTSTTLGNAPSITRTSSGNLYLRSRLKIAPYTWSTASQLINVTVYQTPPPVPSTAVNGAAFPNHPVTLSVGAVAGAMTYKWYDQPTGGTLIAESASISYTINALTASKSYYVSAKTRCETATRKQVTATLVPAPIATVNGGGPLHVTRGQSINLKTEIPYATYAWYRNGTALNITTPACTVTLPGDYKVTVTQTNVSGAGTSSSLKVTLGPTGQNMNYIVSNTVLVKDIATKIEADVLPVDSCSQVIQYFDELGRPIQTVLNQASPNKADIVQPVTYDVVGRQHLSYLPYVSSERNGWFKADAIGTPATYTNSPQYKFYNNGPADITDDTRPYSETIFEASPMNRPVKVFGPGSDWFVNNKYTASQYQTHVTGTGANQEKIICWTITGFLPVRNTAYNSGYYAGGYLAISISKDEQGSQVRTYTDQDGRTILRKIYVQGSLTDLTTSGNWAETYYIYDDFGNLRFVLQPELTKQLVASGANPTQANLDALAFQYKYDARKRMTEKKVPGAGAVYMVYDDRDRLVLTQDGNQRALTAKEWTFVKYDALNRPILTGKYLNNGDLAAVQLAVNDFYRLPLPAGRAFCEKYINTAAGNVLGYENTSFPSIAVPAEYYSVTYYDAYDAYNAPAGYTYVNESLPGQEAINFNRVNGLTVGTYVKNLSTGTWLRTVTYYDNEYRPIQTISDHQKGTLRTSMVYDFPGKPILTKRTYVVNSVTTFIKETFAYDHSGRLLTVKHAMDGPVDVMVVKNEYNELGQPVDKKLHSVNNGTTFKQSVDYRYNIRGWLTKINEGDVSAVASDDAVNDYFGMELAYNGAIPGLTSTTSYNGNISAVLWSKGNGGTVRKQAYSYLYDNMNRLKDANHFDYEKNGAAWQFNSNNNGYGENLTYDLNGNIKTLLRKGFKGASMDNLTYVYNGNQLTTVNDAADALSGFINGNTGADDYSYDFNGNIDKDKNKSLSAKGNIKYNYLNLPIEIIKGTEKVKYIYDALGRKLAQEVYNGATLVKTTDYIGEMVYEGNVLKFIQTSEGRILPDGAAWEYQYHLKDHLGNVRVTFTSKAQTPTSISTNFEAATNANFQNYSTHANNVFDHTDAGTVYQKSQRLLGTGNSRVGLATSIPVMPGDEVSATAFVKYWNLSGTANTNVLITSLAAAFGVSAASTGEQLKIFNGLNNYAGTVLSGVHPLDDDTAPKAFVTILFFDKNYNLVDAAWDQVSTDGATTHDQVAASGKAPEAGYAYVFLSNEHPTAVEVYYDDFTLTHTPSPIVSSSDFMPFGLSFNSGERTGTGTFEQKYLYNGKELQDELSLNWYDYGARMYMPEIGRWGVVDPMAEKYRRWSPYNYCMDNPIRFIDPDGMEVVDVGPDEISYRGDDAAAAFVEVCGGQSSNRGSKNKSEVTISEEGPNPDGPCPPGVDCAGMAKLAEEGWQPDEQAQQGGLPQKDQNKSWLENEKIQFGLLLDGEVIGFFNYHPNIIYVGGPGGGSAVKGLGIAINGSKSLTPAMYTVYKAVTQNGTVYWGMTKDFAQRAAQHGSRFVSITEEYINIGSKGAARGVEQLMMDASGGIKNLENAINSIGPNNPKIMQYYQDAVRYFQTLSK